MNEAERREKYEAQTQALYAAIGRFAVKFEHVCHAMHWCITTLLRAHGLNHQGLENALLSGLTAEPTLTIFRSAINEARRETMSDADKKILKNICSRIKDLIETRNDIVHRTWFVGWASPT